MKPDKAARMNRFSAEPVIWVDFQTTDEKLRAFLNWQLDVGIYRRTEDGWSGLGRYVGAFTPKDFGLITKWFRRNGIKKERR